MKKAAVTLFIFILFLSLVSCNLWTENTNGFTTLPDNNSFINNTWHIANYIKDGKQEKQKYYGYSFRFSKNNNITATQGKHIYTGNWTVISNEGTDDTPPADMDFIIAFKNADNTSLLNSKWIITDRTSSTLRLSSISNHNSIDSLTFEKG